jgi:hypothetical protein
VGGTENLAARFGGDVEVRRRVWVPAVVVGGTLLPNSMSLSVIPDND